MHPEAIQKLKIYRNFLNALFMATLGSTKVDEKDKGPIKPAGGLKPSAIIN